MSYCKKYIALLLFAAMLLSVMPSVVAADDVAEAKSDYIIIEPTPPEGRQYYGRTVLEGMEKTALLYAYDQIVEGVENGAASISVYNGLFPITQDEIKLVMSVYRRDYAHHFWLDNRYGISYNSTTVLKVVPQYLMTGAALTTAKAEFEAAAYQVLSGITPDMTEYEKELYLHDTLAEMVTYRESANAHNAYGALVEGVAVCEGYAEAFQYLLHRADIWSYLVIGSSRGEGHSWNMVQIDGAYYHVDLTWNDQDETVYHGYFNVTDTQIKKDHTIDTTPYDLPKCDSTDAFYYTGKDTYLENYTVDSVARLLQDNDLEVMVFVPGGWEILQAWFYENILTIAERAGVYGGFSYGYTRLGDEMTLRIAKQQVKVTVDSSITYYNNISTALMHAENGAQMKLMDDLSDALQTELQILLDLNGCDIGGVLAGSNITVFDSQTSDYTVNNGNGYGKIAGAVTGATAAEGYIAITEASGTSFHKVDVAVDKLVLKAETVGFYYTGSFCYDEVVAECLSASGIALSTENDAPVADDTDPTSLYTATGNSVLVKNILTTANTAAQNRENAKQKVHARAYLKLQDGTILYSTAKTSNLQTMVETVDAVAWTNLGTAQKDALAQMYDLFSGVMGTWSIPNLKQYT